MQSEGLVKDRPVVGSLWIRTGFSGRNLTQPRLTPFLTTPRFHRSTFRTVWLIFRGRTGNRRPGRMCGGYRRHFTLPNELKRMRVFLHFDGVMVGAAPTINGHILPPHLGGYLPFQYEITDWLKSFLKYIPINHIC